MRTLPAIQETQARSLGREDPLEEGMAPTPVFLPRESHGQRSPVGLSPRARHDLMTKSPPPGSVAVVHGPSCSVPCGIFLDQGLNSCSLLLQLDSHPLRQWGSPPPGFLMSPQHQAGETGVG